MHTIRFFVAIVLAGVTLSVPGEAGAWGSLGHRLVCAVALMQLDDDPRAEVERLAAAFRAPDGERYRYFTGGCNFADRARHRARDGARGFERFASLDPWHYINVPRDAPAVMPRHCSREGCVLSAIDEHFRVFANHDRSEGERAEAMLLLAHWIADAHQPMHVSFADDRGGSRVDVAPGGVYRGRNMHEVWDNDVIERTLGRGDWWDFARALSGSVTRAERRRWRDSSPLEWVRESHRVTVDPRTRYCRMDGDTCRPTSGARRLDAAYADYASRVAVERIRMAGVRLARYLERGLRR